jgi:hypothetical protein
MAMANIAARVIATVHITLSLPCVEQKRHNPPYVGSATNRSCTAGSDTCDHLGGDFKYQAVGPVLQLWAAMGTLKRWTGHVFFHERASESTVGSSEILPSCLRSE